MESAAIEGGPFGSLAIWRSKLQDDVLVATTPQHKMQLLLQQGKDVEQAVQGCLKDSLFELGESQRWGLLGDEFVDAQQHHLVNLAAMELVANKQLCLELAREHGVLEPYASELRRPHSDARTVADYEKLEDLRFALLAWRADLHQVASLAAQPEEALSLLRSGYLDALRLIKRCTATSMRFWAAQRAHGAPTDASKRAVYAAAVPKAQLLLRDVAVQHGVAEEELRSWFESAGDPDSVGSDDESDSEQV